MKKTIIKRIFTSLTILALVQNANAQCDPRTGFDPVGRPCGGAIQTSTVFLRIAPDARGAAMGDAGIATEADANSMHYNASKMVFAANPFSGSVTYTPWLQALGVNDVYMAYLSGYAQFGSGERKQAAGLSVRFFSLGQIPFADDIGTPLNVGQPREVEVAAAYARQLSKNLSVAGSLKFIYSNLATGQTVANSAEPIRSARAGAVDVSMTYRKPFLIGDKKSDLQVGLAISNLGNKVNYNRTSDFLPTTLGIGLGWSYHFDQYNQINLAFDISKLLVPTPRPLDTADVDGNRIPDWKDASPVEGVFNSFADAPGGAREELKELMYSVGVEYWYDKQFAVRAGYYYEDRSKGGRRYLTAGLGLRYSFLGINLSYLVPQGGIRGPLDNTLRFSLIFDLNSFKPDQE